MASNCLNNDNLFESLQDSNKPVVIKSEYSSVDENVIEETVFGKSGLGPNVTAMTMTNNSNMTTDITEQTGLSSHGMAQTDIRAILNWDQEPAEDFKRSLSDYDKVVSGYARVMGVKHHFVSGALVSSLTSVSTIIGMASLYRMAMAESLRPRPQHGDMHIAHLDKKMCELLLDNTRVYDSVLMGDDMVSWAGHKVHSGDIVGQARTQIFDKMGLTASQINDGISVSFAGIRGVTFGSRVMISLPVRYGVDNHATDVELAFGGLRVRSVAGYTHFGISIPSEYFSKLVFHVRRTSAVFCLFQTGRINKTFGELAKHRSLFSNIPSVRFSHPLGSCVDVGLTPKTITLYDVVWSGATQTVFQATNTQFFHAGHVTMLFDGVVAFNILVPTRKHDTMSTFAILSHDTTLNHNAAMQFSDHLSGLRSGTGSGVGGVATWCSHHVENLRIITYNQKSVYNYRVLPRGVFSDITNQFGTFGAESPGVVIGGTHL